MISIISAVHNQLGMNKLYVEKLKEYTKNKYELIIIDNNSTDGSREFFKKHADVVIENSENFSYPYCQNQGIAKAKYNKLAFFNNDIIVSPGWDEKILEVQKQHNIAVVSFASIDRLESQQITSKVRNRWKRIKYPLLLLGTGKKNLAFMHKLMYGNWEKYTQNRFDKFGYDIMEGVAGSAVMVDRDVLDKIGLWDERIQAADFDIFCRLKERINEHGDVKSAYVALGIYFHHYTRLTLKAGYTPFTDLKNHITFEEKWGDKAKELMKGVDF